MTVLTQPVPLEVRYDLSLTDLVRDCRFDYVAPEVTTDRFLVERRPRRWVHVGIVVTPAGRSLENALLELAGAGYRAADLVEVLTLVGRQPFLKLPLFFCLGTVASAGLHRAILSIDTLDERHLRLHRVPVCGALPRRRARLAYVTAL